MKKLLMIIGVIAILSTSCSNNDNLRNITTRYKTIQIEGCDYVVYDRTSGYVGHGYMAHKGNCVKCAAKRKREINILFNKSVEITNR